MGIEDYGNENVSNSKRKNPNHRVDNRSANDSVRSASDLIGTWDTRTRSKNYGQIFVLSFDALRERKTRSALTILMVVVGGALMVALNGTSAGQSAFMNKQMSMLAPNVLFVSSGQMSFRGPQGPPTIVLNNEVVNRIKSLPFVQEVVPSYQGQLQLNAQVIF
ncbi:MAG TPA: ABC transporter permease [Nitrososphaeraceae archaeon]